MSDTPSFTPTDAIIDLGDGRKKFNAPLYILGILRDEWNAANVDGKTPNIDLSTEHKVQQFRRGDWITVYGVSEVTEPVAITYNFENHTHIVTIDMFTSHNTEGYKHLVKMEAEAQRIIHNHRKDTFGIANVNGRAWAKWGIRSTPYERTSKLFYRRQVDVEIRHRFDKVIT